MKKLIIPDLNKLGLGKNEQTVVDKAFKNNGKSTTTYIDGRKRSEFFVRVKRKDKKIKVHKIIFQNSIKIEDKKNTYSY